MKLCGVVDCGKPAVERTFRFLLKGKTEEHKGWLCEKHTKEMADQLDALLGVKGVRHEAES